VSEVQWFLWTFMVLGVLDGLADIDMAREFGAVEGFRACMWHHIVWALVKAVLVVWAFRLSTLVV
jgi:hypothetical protein